MNKYVSIISVAIGLAAFGFLTSSCGLKSVSTHKMGPPGKSHSMPDDQMPSRSGR